MRHPACTKDMRDKEEEEAGVLTRAQRLVRLVKKQLDGKKKERDDILFATR